MAKTPEERARAKYADYCRAIGKPLIVTQAEVTELRAHLGGLYERGMSYKQIADSAPGGHSETGVAKILNGTYVSVHRSVYNHLMLATFEVSYGRKTGRKVPSHGVRRRLQALVAQGFGYTVLGDLMDVSIQAVYQLIRSNRTHSSTLARITILYDKLQNADPMDYGSTELGVVRAKAAARKHGWAPPHCWDPDTIDDPDAFPEWTGACGTVQGWRIHYRDKIEAGSTHTWESPLDVDWFANMANPLVSRYVHRYIGGPTKVARQVPKTRTNVTRSDTSCDACANARHISRQFPHLAELLEITPPPCRPGSNDGEADWPGIAAAIDSGEYSMHAIAADFGVSSRTVQRVKREMSNGGDV